ncbi:MAG: aminotransferase class V-fold PLP-dependent enzyme [Cyanobacteria bacterium SBLK]|nr:aminotransferase class V-fold PLP-dependent enzyme [Cyanobacteria bacterium SBLK]
MFEPIDPKIREKAAMAIDEAAVHRLFDPIANAKILSPAECDKICTNIYALLKLTRNTELSDEDFWTEFQQRFGFASEVDKIIPINAANLCPEPTELLDSANTLRLAYNNNVAQQVRMAEGERVQQLEQARELLVEGVGLDSTNPDDVQSVAMVRNASEANNAIGCGFRNWSSSERENVVLWSENHPTNLEAWRLRAEWNNPEGLFDIIIVDFDPNASDAEIQQAFTDNINEQTRFCAYSKTSNGSGFRIPDTVTQGIWNHVQTNSYDCHIHIDGTMVWGAESVNLSTPYCHSFISSAHKWFLGPKETGLFWMSKDKVQNFMPSIFAYDYKITIGDWQDMPDTALRFELLGQRDDVNLITLATTQMMWTSLQINNPYDRVAELATYLIDGLEARNPGRWTFVTPLNPARRWGVVRIEAPIGNRGINLYDWIYEASEYRIAGSGDDATFRLCPHIYNTKADIDLAIEGMNAWYDLPQ